jgi:hypothetical protein
MIGRRAVIGLSLLSALLFCALGAQSASAGKAVNNNGYMRGRTLGKGDLKTPTATLKAPPKRASSPIPRR